MQSPLTARPHRNPKYGGCAGGTFRTTEWFPTTTEQRYEQVGQPKMA